jgi:hypothetical protein
MKQLASGWTSASCSTKSLLWCTPDRPASIVPALTGPVNDLAHVLGPEATDGSGEPRWSLTGEHDGSVEAGEFGLAIAYYRKNGAAAF